MVKGRVDLSFVGVKMLLPFMVLLLLLAGGVVDFVESTVSKFSRDSSLTDLAALCAAAAAVDVTVESLVLEDFVVDFVDLPTLFCNFITVLAFVLLALASNDSLAFNSV